MQIWLHDHYRYVVAYFQYMYSPLADLSHFGPTGYLLQVRSKALLQMAPILKICQKRALFLEQPIRSEHQDESKENLETRFDWSDLFTSRMEHETMSFSCGWF